METQKSQEVLTELEIDAIGEIMNISMGAAATAMSTMLDMQVIITTPQVSLKTLKDVNYSTLEPAMLVKITYVQGISGSNIMVFRQLDMQVILNQLMGSDTPPSEDYVFDEMSMSAACEVMNQMMGSSATALSGFLGKSINISTPTAFIMDDDHTFLETNNLSPDQTIVSILFNLSIGDIVNSEFIIVMTIDLAKGIVDQLMNESMGSSTQEAPAPEIKASPTPSQQALSAQPPQQQAIPEPQVMTPPQPQAQPAQPPMAPPVGQAPPAPAPYLMPPMQQYYENMPMPPQMMGGGYPANPYYPPYGGYPGYHPGQPQYPYPMQTPPEEHSSDKQKIKKSIDVQTPKFPNYTTITNPGGDPVMGSNMDLIMNVALNVSVEIGKTRKKIKDIMDYAQGTVIELEKQAGAPVDIIVNGQLIARGDVVVIDDNFGVRITEILGTKELLKTL